MTVRTPGSGAEAAVCQLTTTARAAAPRRAPLYRPWLYTAQKNEAIASCVAVDGGGGGRAAARKAVASSFAQLGPSDTEVVAQKPSFVIVVTCGDTLCGRPSSRG